MLNLQEIEIVFRTKWKSNMFSKLYICNIQHIFQTVFFSPNNPWANVFPVKKSKNVKKLYFLPSFHSLQMQQGPEEKSGYVV